MPTVKKSAGKPLDETTASLIDRAGVTESLQLAPSTESVWIDVIRKMDSVYADLVRYQVELEEKNTALEQADQFINSILSAMTDVLIACDTKGRILQINAALEKLTGKPAASFIDQPIEQMFAVDSKIKMEACQQIPENEFLIDYEVNILCADGSSTPLAMNCSSRYDHMGTMVGMVLIGRPVGELRHAYDDLNRAHIKLQQTQQQLVHSEKMASLGRLVAGVAHELNNPISVVFGNMHALQRYGSRMTEYLHEVDAHHVSAELAQLRSELKIDRIIDDMQPLIEGTLEASERVSDIVQDLRRYSGAQAEGISEFDLSAVIIKAVEWVTRASRIKPQVEYELPQQLLIEGRKGQVHQILVNLVQNALDAMQDQASPQLSLHCQTSGDRIRVEVIDQGPGIPESDLPHIFDPFFTSKPVGQGTGLGLYISYGLASDLGGDLHAENLEQGGVKFTLTLPVSMNQKLSGTG